MTIRDFDKQIFLGGSHKEDETRCFSLCNRTVKAEPLLKRTHEEADDRVLFHVNHAVNVGRFGSVVVASSDTDIFVSAAHHFNKLMYNDLQELWLISGRSESRSVVPINDLVDAMDPDFILDGIKAFRKKHSNISRMYCYNITSDWLIYFQPIRFTEMIKLISRQSEDNFHNT